MECNRDEALRAKEIAEKKFLANDIAGSKKFALKAQNLFPSLDGIGQMIATLDVYLSSGATSGDKDWYGILSVNPAADDETVKKQFRKLALQLHPDKNKSVGAEGAFQLISEACSVLSDRSKRMLYDHKRLGKTFPQKTTAVKKDHPAPTTANGRRAKSNNSSAPKVRVQQSNTGTAPASCNSKPPSSQPSKPETFWTSCNRCKMHYEYIRLYLNCNLVCPNKDCRESFVASEIAVPIKGPNGYAQISSQQLYSNSNLQSTTKSGHGTSTFHNVGSSGGLHGVGPNINSSSNFHFGTFSRTAGAASASASSTAAAQAANVVHNTYDKVRREREEAQAASRRKGALPKSGLKQNSFGLGSLNAGFSGNECYKNVKRRKGIIDDPKMNYGRGSVNVGMYTANFVNYTANSRQFNIGRGFPQAHVLTTLMGKSKQEIHKKVEALISERAAKSAENEGVRKKQMTKENAKGKIASVNPVVAADQQRVDELKSNSKQAPSVNNLANTKDADSEKEAVEAMNIDVPDADFHDFDGDRTEKSFKGDEVWATYDDEDGMPRFYALVQKVKSYKPFKVRMSFLTSRSNSEFGPLNWVSSGFAKTCGDFRVSRYDVIDTLNVFSHKVKWEKLHGVIKIVPKQGDVWALYRNWAPDWNEHTLDDVMYKYDMVEVLEDYNEVQGVSVTPLVKVTGFKTVFHRHLDPNKVKRIPREEMFRFSHQVPSYVLTGEEGPNAPKGCYELDPAAIPLELLQVVTKSKTDEATQASNLPH